MTEVRQVIRIDRWVAAVAVLLLLAACGSSAPVHYYSLSVTESNYDGEVDGSRELGVGPLRIPRYLSRTRIAIRGSNSEIIIDDFNRWVEPFDRAIHRIIAANVDGLLPDFAVGAFPYDHFVDFEYQLIGRIDRFDADQAGHVVLLVQWGVMHRESGFIVRPRRDRFATRASIPDDYGSIATAMSDVLAQFSRAVARELESATYPDE